MEGFQTFARSRDGVCFSVVEEAVAGSFPFPARLPVRKKPAANPISIALHPGGTFMPKTLGNSDSRCQDFPDGVSSWKNSTDLAADTAAATAIMSWRKLPRPA